MFSRYIGCILTLLFLMTATSPANAYVVKGRLSNVGNCYYPRVYLEAIKGIDGFYGTASDNLIATADVDATGSFLISGKDLPKDKHYYRLYVTSDANVSSSMLVGAKRNYVLLLLNNESEVEVSTDDFCAANFTYTTTSPDNNAIAALQNIISEYMNPARESFTVTKQEYTTRTRYEELKHFADTTHDALVALVAVSEMGIEEHYRGDKDFFLGFLKRLQQAYPQSDYTLQYKELLNLQEYKHTQKSGEVIKLSPTPVLLYLLLGLSLLLNVYLVVTRLSKRSKDKGFPEPDNSTEDDERRMRAIIEALSIREREILLLLNEGLSNKEIAEREHVELSTVKTHVSRIYQKAGISSRKEVAAIARYLS